MLLIWSTHMEIEPWISGSWSGSSHSADCMLQGGIHPLHSGRGPQSGHHREGPAGPGRVGVQRDRAGRTLLSKTPPLSSSALHVTAACADMRIPCSRQLRPLSTEPACPAGSPGRWAHYTGGWHAGARSRLHLGPGKALTRFHLAACLLTWLSSRLARTEATGKGVSWHARCR